MSKAKTAKTASKNNPTARTKAADVFYNDKKVKPALLIDGKRRCVVAVYEDGTMPMDANGSPMPWADVRN